MNIVKWQCLRCLIWSYYYEFPRDFGNREILHICSLLVIYLEMKGFFCVCVFNFYARVLNDKVVIHSLPGECGTMERTPTFDYSFSLLSLRGRTGWSRNRCSRQTGDNRKPATFTSLILVKFPVAHRLLRQRAAFCRGWRNCTWPKY